MSDQNKRVAEQFIDAVNAHDTDRLLDYLSEDFVEHEVFPGLEANRDGVQQFFALFIGAFPDFRMEVQRILAEGDIVAVHSVFTGTHQGEFMGMPGTGRQIAVPVVDIVRIEGDRAAEHWGVTDSGKLMQQLGAIPEEAPA